MMPMVEWTIENLTLRLRQIQRDAAWSDEEMCDFLDDFLQRYRREVEEEPSS